MKAYFDHSTDESASIKTFWFRTERPLDYVAGQYTELTVPHSATDNRGQKRWFTLSSPPGHEFVSITTRRSRPGSTFKDALFALKPGTQVWVTEPMGDFVLPLDTQIPLVFIASGIGITPVRSIVASLSENHERRTITIIHTVKDRREAMPLPDSVAFCDYRLHIWKSASKTGTKQLRIIDAEHILTTVLAINKTLFYISGPDYMVEAVRNDLLAHNIPRMQLITDPFTGYTVR